MHRAIPGSSTFTDRGPTPWLVALGVVAALLGAVSAGIADAPSQTDLSARAVMALPAPPIQRYAARDGASLAYRFFAPEASSPPSGAVAILLHGSAGSSLNMTVLGEALAKAGVPTYAPDIRGQGLSGRRGDIDYIGQLDDDLEDFVAMVRKTYPDARLVLVGHSAGGGFALRIAGEAEGRLFGKIVLLSPVLGRLAPTNRPDAGWACPHVGKIVLLEVLNTFGVTAFNGDTAVDFNLPPGSENLGLTRSWSFRLMRNFGPNGQTQLFGTPAYLEDAAHAQASLIVIAGTADEQFKADMYEAAFNGVAKPVRVELVPDVDHMGVLSDPRAVALIVAAVEEN